MSSRPESCVGRRRILSTVFLLVIAACGEKATPGDLAGLADLSKGAGDALRSAEDAAHSLDGGPECLQLGWACTPGQSSCCDGTCESGGRGGCCHGGGGNCNPSNPLPDNECCGGFVCNRGNGLCETMTCNQSSCTSTPGLPCCDPKLQCRSDPHLMGIKLCCAPDGTTFPAGSHPRCCNDGLGTNSDGTVTCITPQPPP